MPVSFLGRPVYVCQHIRIIKFHPKLLLKTDYNSKDQVQHFGATLNAFRNSTGPPSSSHACQRGPAQPWNVALGPLWHDHSSIKASDETWWAVYRKLCTWSFVMWLFFIKNFGWNLMIRGVLAKVCTDLWCLQVVVFTAPVTFEAIPGTCGIGISTTSWGDFSSILVFMTQQEKGQVHRIDKSEF